MVIFVDYGNSENVPHPNIRPMPSKFLELPCLAVHCIMSGKKYSCLMWPLKVHIIVIESVRYTVEPCALWSKIFVAGQ